MIEWIDGNVILSSTMTTSYIEGRANVPLALLRDVSPGLKGQMHYQNDLGSKWAYTCHLSNRTAPEPVLFSTTQL